AASMQYGSGTAGAAGAEGVPAARAPLTVSAHPAVRAPLNRVRTPNSVALGRLRTRGPAASHLIRAARVDHPVRGDARLLRPHGAVDQPVQLARGVRVGV